MTLEADDLREFAVLSGAVSTALIQTEDGPVPLDWVACGDRVLTRDAGFQPVRWVARTPLDIRFLRAYPEVSPVTLPQGHFGPTCPVRDLPLSPSQLMPLTTPDGTEVLVTADVMGDPIYPFVRSKSEKYTYVNVLLDGHHLICVDGAWMGSLFTADLDAAEGGQGAMVPLAPILDRSAALSLWASVRNAAAQHSA